jgi:hypothetical protein
MSFGQILYIWIALTVIAAIAGPLSNIFGRRPRDSSGASHQAPH